MKNRIRTYLVQLAPVLAANVLSSSSESGQREYAPSTSWLVKMFATFADCAGAEGHRDLDRLSEELYAACADGRAPAREAAEWIRLGRDAVLARLNGDLAAIAGTETEREPYLQAMVQLYQVVDQVLARLFHVGQAGGIRNLEAVHGSEEGGAEEYFSEVAEQELVQLVLKSNDIAVLMIDRQKNIIEANYELARLFRVDRDQIIGRNIDEAFCPHDSERFVQWVIERGQSGHYVAEYNSQWTTVSTSPIYRNGELCGAIAVMRNITDSKRYEEELTKREALAAVGQLAAGMAHEIRNPLTSIKGFIQLLREQGDNKRRESYFSVILTEIERIDGLLNDVLVLARYRDDKIVSERFLVMEEVYGVVRLLEPEANRRGIRLELQIGQGDWYIYGHRPRIKQAFLNILKNAFEALMGKGTLVRVSVFASINQVVITVEDDGIGLSEEAKQNLFVPFYTTKQEGTGLGLSTTQRIINDHGGEIFADDSPKLGGARFEIRLPLCQNGQI